MHTTSSLAFLVALALMALCAAVLACAVLVGDVRSVLHNAWFALAGLVALLVMLVSQRAMVRHAESGARTA